MPTLCQNLAINAAVHVVHDADITGGDFLKTHNAGNQAEDHHDTQNNCADFTLHPLTPLLFFQIFLPPLGWRHADRLAEHLVKMP